MGFGHWNIFRRFAVALGGAIALASCASSAAPSDPAELIFTNARVYTVEQSQPWAEAVAVRDGRILAVGSTSDIERLRGPSTRVVDVGGRLLMPSFGDMHVHPRFGGLAYSRCSLHDAQSIDDYAAIIRRCVAASPGDAPIYGVGWEDEWFAPSGAPRKEILDEITTDRALVFEARDGHSYWVNSRALQLAGITRDTPNPPNGRIVRDERTGEPSGGLQESAMALVRDLIPQPSAAELEGSILYTAQLFNSLGITSWHDAGVELGPDGASETLAAYRAVHDRGELTMNVTIAFTWANERSLEQIPVILEASRQAESWGLRAHWVKFYVDGVVPQRTAAMLAPYEGTTESGGLHIPPDVLSTAITRLGEAGIQSHTHAIGDRAVRVSLDAFEAARAHNRTNFRPMISHMNVIDPADQPRFGALEAIAVFQPTWSSNYLYMDLTKQAIGPTRSGYIYPSGSVLRVGGMLAFGADWPVATANPLEGLQVAITRTNYQEPETGPLLPEEAITLEQAVRAHTLNVAFANGLEDVTGSIAVGKSADLIVLDRNIFDLPANEIGQARVVMTLFRGHAVFGSLDLEPTPAN